MADRAAALVRREQKLQAINLLEDVMDTSSATFLACGANFRSLVRYDLGFLVRGAVAGSKRPSRVKTGQVERHVGEPARTADCR